LADSAKRAPFERKSIDEFAFPSKNGVHRPKVCAHLSL
jgi:hypothetical protein